MELRIRADVTGPVPYAFYQPLAQEHAETVIDELGDPLNTDPEGRLVCIYCRQVVTTQRDRIAMAGQHRHTCTNPHGIRFDIGCFRRAEGCRRSGEATRRYSWFEGYAWAVGVCVGCQAHLGWAFSAEGGGGFFGLILERLDEAGAGS